MAQEQYAAIATASTSHLVIGTSDDTAVADYLGGDFDTEYLDVADTPGIKHRLTRAGIDTDDLVVISVVGAATADDVESGIFGHSGGALPKSLCAMTDVDRDAMVVEAAASAWNARLCAAARSIPPATATASTDFGRLLVDGSPTLLELHADRQAALDAEDPDAAAVQFPSAELEVASAAAAELAKRTKFGIVALQRADDDQFDEQILAAVSDGDWVACVPLMLAANEIVAMESMLAARAILHGAAVPGADTMLSRIEQCRAAADLLAALADQLVVHLTSHAPRMQRLTNPAKHKRAQTALRAAMALQAMKAPVPWEQSDSGNDTEADIPHAPIPTDELAVLLGKEFRAALPTARKAAAAIRSTHPDETTEQLVRHAKKQALKELTNPAARPSDETLTIDIVASLTMTIAELRGIETRDDAMFEALGTRLLGVTEAADRAAAAADAAMPVAHHAVRFVQQRFQRVLVEMLFHKMAGVKPAKPGAARDAYKQARSRVWRARHDPAVATHVVDGAMRGLHVAVTSGNARNLIRRVDKILTS